VLVEQNQKPHDEIGGWPMSPDAQRWCKNILEDSYGAGNEKSFHEMVDWLTRTGHTAEARQQLARLGPNPLQDYPKETMVRAHRQQIERQGLLAWDCGRLAAVVGWGFHAGFNDENETWRILHGNAARIQQTYGSWREFGEAYMMGRLWWAQGQVNPKAKMAAINLIGNPHSPWNRLPWQMPLGQPPAPSPGGGRMSAKVRFKKSVCPSCGGHKTKPSPTAYVYCDYCGALADYDFAKACEGGPKQPGPAYTALTQQLGPALQQAKAAQDINGYRNLQRQLFETYIDALPYANPPRVKEPEYRKKYVEYMAEGGTVIAFDQTAQQWEAEVNRTIMGLQYAMPKPGVMKISPQTFAPMANAVFQQQDYLFKTLYTQRGVLDKHPDHVPPELQKRIGISLFVQGWLPMLDEQTTQTFLQQAGLKTEYVEVDPPKGDKADCGGCGNHLEILPGAKRCVCEQCGQALELGAERISCHGCGAPLAPTEGSRTVTCPHCKNQFQRVQMNMPKLS
jgi:LSD1 subclass zinc finger protein